jgi:hypothetical protein
LQPCGENVQFEDFAGAVLFARDVGSDINSRKLRVDFRPLLVRVGDELAVDDDLGSESLVEVGRNVATSGLEASVAKTMPS